MSFDSAGNPNDYYPPDTVKADGPSPPVTSAPRPSKAVPLPNEEIPRENIKADNREEMLGRMVFTIPDTMIVGTQYVAKVSLTKLDNIEIQITTFSRSERQDLTVVDSLDLTNRIMVSLKDPSDGENFFIKSINSETQKVDDKSNTMWKWYVRPLTGGQHQLELMVSNRFNENDSRAENDISEPAFERIINVQSDYIYASKNFCEKYWQWIIGTVLLPFGLWSFNLIKKKREDNKNKDEDENKKKLEEENKKTIGFKPPKMGI